MITLPPPLSKTLNESFLLILNPLPESKHTLLSRAVPRKHATLDLNV